MADRSREQLRRVQIVFQHADTALNPAQSVGEILARPLAFYHGLKGAAATARVAELLDLIQLPRDIVTRRSSELSGGQKQRVNLARALAANPDVLICDEVTSALDTVVAAAILDLIDDLRRDLGIATIFISHDISTARAFCDDLAGSLRRKRRRTGQSHAFCRRLASTLHPAADGFGARHGHELAGPQKRCGGPRAGGSGSTHRAQRSAMPVPAALPCRSCRHMRHHLATSPRAGGAVHPVPPRLGSARARQRKTPGLG